MKIINNKSLFCSRQVNSSRLLLVVVWSSVVGSPVDERSSDSADKVDEWMSKINLVGRPRERESRRARERDKAESH